MPKRQQREGERTKWIKLDISNICSSNDKSPHITYKANMIRMIKKPHNTLTRMRKKEQHQNQPLAANNNSTSTSSSNTRQWKQELEHIVLNAWWLCISCVSPIDLWENAAKATPKRNNNQKTENWTRVYHFCGHKLIYTCKWNEISCRLRVQRKHYVVAVEL